MLLEPAAGVALSPKHSWGGYAKIYVAMRSQNQGVFRVPSHVQGASRSHRLMTGCPGVWYQGEGILQGFLAMGGMRGKRRDGALLYKGVLATAPHLASS